MKAAIAAARLLPLEIAPELSYDLSRNPTEENPRMSVRPVLDRKSVV